MKGASSRQQTSNFAIKQKKRKQTSVHSRKSSVQSRNKSKSKTRQQTSRSTSKPKSTKNNHSSTSQSRLSNNIIYSSLHKGKSGKSNKNKKINKTNIQDLDDDYTNYDYHNPQNKSGHFQIKLIENPQYFGLPSSNTTSNNTANSTKRSSMRKSNHQKRESFDLNRVHKQSKNHKMFESTVLDQQQHYQNQQQQKLTRIQKYQQEWRDQMSHNDYFEEDHYDEEQEQDQERPRTLNSRSGSIHKQDRQRYVQAQFSDQPQTESDVQNNEEQNDHEYFSTSQSFHQNFSKDDNIKNSLQNKKHQNSSKYSNDIYQEARHSSQYKIVNQKYKAQEFDESMSKKSVQKTKSSHQSFSPSPTHSNLNYSNIDKVQKDLSRYKQKAYDYKFQIESLKKRLQDTEDQVHTWKTKFENEQDKSDEFFTKAEKYKLLTKDFRRENEILKKENEDMKEQFSMEVRNYETLVRLKEEQEDRNNRQRNIIVRQIIDQLQNLENYIAQTNMQYSTIEPLKQIYQMLEHLQNIDGNSESLIKSKSYDVQNTLNQESQSIASKNMFYISEGKEKFKISQDLIMFNGESLNQEEGQSINRFDLVKQDITLFDQYAQQSSALYPQNNMSQVRATTQTLIDSNNSQQNQQQQFTSQFTPATFKLVNLNSEDQTNQQPFDDQLQDQNTVSSQKFFNNPPSQQTTQANPSQPGVVNDQSQHSPLVTQSNLNNPLSYDLLLQIHQEMQQVRAQQVTLLEENEQLKSKNQVLIDELENQKQRSEQSLMPQYKEAFEQMRRTNENMQKRMEQMENERIIQQQNIQNQKQIQNQNSDKSKIENEMREMQGQISKINYENANLRLEREQLVNQIQNLQSFNKKQEKMLKYFQLLNSNQQSALSNNNSSINQQHLKLQENFDMNGNQLNTSSNRAQSKNSLLNSNSTNNMRVKMSKILDQETSLQDNQMMYSEFSKSPNSQQFISNRTGGVNQTQQQEQVNQVQAFTLNNNTQSDFNLTQSFLNKTNQSKFGNMLIKGPPLTMNQFQPNATDSSMYIETGVNDKVDGFIPENIENNVFSLSSTQPENQMRMSSPINYLARHIDFNLSNPNIQNSGKSQSNQLNTGNFKQSTMKDCTSYHNLHLNQFPASNNSGNKSTTVDPSSIFLMPQSAQNKSQSPIEQLRIQDIMHTTHSQEVTNRDKSGGGRCQSNGAVTNTNGLNINSTIQKSTSDLSNSQIIINNGSQLPCAAVHLLTSNNNGTQSLSQSYLQSSALASQINASGFVNNQNGNFIGVNFNQASQSSAFIPQQLQYSNQNLYQLKSGNFMDTSSDCQTSNSERSMEIQIMQNRNSAYLSSKNPSQETFQGKNINASINSNSQYLQQLKSSNNNSSLNGVQPITQYPVAQKLQNKENLIMIDDDMIFKNHLHHHQSSNQSKILSSKIKSPAFYESNHMNSDSEIQTISQHHQTHHQESSSYDQKQAIFNQQIILDGLVGHNQQSKAGQSSGDNSYCTTDKHNTLTSGFLSGLSQSVGLNNVTGGLGLSTQMNNIKESSFSQNQMSVVTQNMNETSQVKCQKNQTNQSLQVMTTSQQNPINQSMQSNFMSERTINLKKEISSLNDEIQILQNNLKEALIQKSNQLDESSIE